MAQYIDEGDIYAAFQAKKLKATCSPDEKVVKIMGCPTVVKKNWLDKLLTFERKGKEALREGVYEKV